jgi:hypothetical protein
LYRKTLLKWGFAKYISTSGNIATINGNSSYMEGIQ